MKLAEVPADRRAYLDGVSVVLDAITEAACSGTPDDVAAAVDNVAVHLADAQLRPGIASVIISMYAGFTTKVRPGVCPWYSSDTCWNLHSSLEWPSPDPSPRLLSSIQEVGANVRDRLFEWTDSTSRMLLDMCQEYVPKSEDDAIANLQRTLELAAGMHRRSMRAHRNNPPVDTRADDWRDPSARMLWEVACSDEMSLSDGGIVCELDTLVDGGFNSVLVCAYGPTYWRLHHYGRRDYGGTMLPIVVFMVTSDCVHLCINPMTIPALEANVDYVHDVCQVLHLNGTPQVACYDADDRVWWEF